MQKVANINRLPLKKSSAETGLDIYHWKPMMSYDGGWTGQIVVQLTTPLEVQQLHSAIHGKGIEIQSHTAAIYVDSDYIDLDRRQLSTKPRGS